MRIENAINDAVDYFMENPSSWIAFASGLPSQTDVRLVLNDLVGEEGYGRASQSASVKKVMARLKKLSKNLLMENPRRVRRNPRNESVSAKLRRKRAYYIGQGVDGKFSSTKSQIVDMLISKLSYLRNNRDENLESFLVRKRPRYPRDYIVILKHRKYVDGARVYSAGQKAEGAIRQFATILGAKAKRVGQSDYVFTTYGVRFPEERKKSSPGKLFDNSSMSERYKKQSVRYLVTKKFTAGPMKGMTIVDESPVPFYVGFKPSKPYFGSPYIVTKTQVNFTGKRNLLPNPKSFPNIDKSKFNKGQYVGYSPKAVNIFSIKRNYPGWQAIGQIYKTIGAGHQQGYPGVTTKIIYGKDLAQISKALENL